MFVNRALECDAVNKAGFGFSEHSFADEREWCGGVIDVLLLELDERVFVAFGLDLRDSGHDFGDSFGHFFVMDGERAFIGAVSGSGFGIEGERAVFHEHADLDGCEVIGPAHVAEAVQYRSMRLGEQP